MKKLNKTSDQIESIEDKLAKFVSEKSFRGKGPLCVALVVTRHARDRGLPLDSAQLITEGRGQVAGLGKSSVQTILKKHGIVRVLAEEGGRTSRGSIGHMGSYVEFLNSLHEDGLANLDIIEKWWIERVKIHFAGKPFKLNLDPSKSMRAAIRELLSQARKRQQDLPGSTFLGTVLQHLVGAKLELLLVNEVSHFGASVADAVSSRPGDFVLGDVAVHVTTSPTPTLLEKCRKNLDASLKPLIVTTHDGAAAAKVHAQELNIEDRVDVFECEQFLASNLHELGKFEDTGRRTTAAQLIERYNRIASEHEDDPGLQIEIAK
jgi:hypothetical protein